MRMVEIDAKDMVIRPRPAKPAPHISLINNEFVKFVDLKPSVLATPSKELGDIGDRVLSRVCALVCRLFGASGIEVLVGPNLIRIGSALSSAQWSNNSLLVTR